MRWSSWTIYGRGLPIGYSFPRTATELIKVYGNPSDEDRRRYSPGECIAVRKVVRSGLPNLQEASTSYVERHNLTMRMSMRRFTRLTNAFSKKIENHARAVALYSVWYNFCRTHSTLKTTPAVAAGLAQYPRNLRWIVGLIDEREARLKP